MADQWIILPPTTLTPLVSTKVDQPLVPGSSVTFVSSSYNPKPNTDLRIDGAGFNLINGDDILLHISVRRAQNQISFHSRRGNTWDAERGIKLSGIFSGPSAVINVSVTPTTYEVSFNNSSVKHAVPKAIPGDPIAISYYEDEHREHTFSNPVIAALFLHGVYIVSFYSHQPRLWIMFWHFLRYYWRSCATIQRIRGWIYPCCYWLVRWCHINRISLSYQSNIQDEYIFWIFPIWDLFGIVVVEGNVKEYLSISIRTLVSWSLFYSKLCSRMMMITMMFIDQCMSILHSRLLLEDDFKAIVTLFRQRQIWTVSFGRRPSPLKTCNL